MARHATKERLDRDAARFGLTPPAAPPEKNYDLLKCPQCRRLLGEHPSIRDVKECMRLMAERAGVQP